MKWLKIVFGITLAFCITFTIIFGATFTERKIKTSPEYKGVISLWHIETFEGGLGSRKEFLLKTSARFEKQNKGVLIMVTSHTPESYYESVKSGVYPDMVSYGVGVSIKNQTEIKTNSPFRYGTVGDTEYASCWCMGGYFLIENKNAKGSSVVVSNNRYTSSLTALALAGIEFNGIAIEEQTEAYYQFVNGKYRYLLATQREIYKLSNRGFEHTAKPILEYNDLYQYVSVTSTSPEKSFFAQEFINFLLSEDNQNRLKEIGMCSYFYKNTLENEYVNELSYSNVVNAPSSFTTLAEMESLKEVSLKVINGKENKDKIKNLLF